LRAETVEMPLMVSEPPHVRPEQREKLVQLLFEKFQPPALFIAKTNVLSSFAVGRPTSLVIDCGASGASSDTRTMLLLLLLLLCLSPHRVSRLLFFNRHCRVCCA
jgi:Actin